MKHLLKLKDLTSDEIFGILNLADQLKYERKNNVKHPYLEGKKLGMIFQKSSTRTRVSFEVGMYELGGYAPVSYTHLGRGNARAQSSGRSARVRVRRPRSFAQGGGGRSSFRFPRRTWNEFDQIGRGRTFFE